MKKLSLIFFALIITLTVSSDSRAGRTLPNFGQGVWCDCGAPPPSGWAHCYDDNGQQCEAPLPDGITIEQDEASNSPEPTYYSLWFDFFSFALPFAVLWRQRKPKKK